MASPISTSITTNIDAAKVLDAFGGLDIVHVLLITILVLVAVIVYSVMKSNKYLKRRIKMLDEEKSSYIKQLINKNKKKR